MADIPSSPLSLSCYYLGGKFFVGVLFIAILLFSYQGGEGKYISDNIQDEDYGGAWKPTILRSSSSLQLMGPNKVRKLERALINSKRKSNQASDGGSDAMGGFTTYSKEGRIIPVWNDEGYRLLSSSLVSERLWPDWHVPVLLAVCAFIGGLGLSVVILFWLKNQMSSNSSLNEKDLPGGNAGSGHTDGGQWIYHPVIPPMTRETVPNVSTQLGSYQGILPEVMTAKNCAGMEKRQEPIRIKAKGLLERRGSSASLTIDLLHPSQENLGVTPTRECTAEEYLLSVGNVLSRKQLRACLKDVRALHREFWDLPLNHPEKLIVPGSGSKNRYRTIIPNEATRVCLPQNSPSDTLTGYINANYIRGYDGEEKAFIATQGPLPHTVNDFWTMIWEEHSPVIVMFTKLWEKSHSKCEPYFPMEILSSVNYGVITITVKSIQVKDGYTVRHLEMKKGDEVQYSIHFWYDSWPDHKTPANAHSLLCLAKEVEIARCIGGHGQRQNSPSVWSKGNESPSTVVGNENKSQHLSAKSNEISPHNESDASPLSLKEVSPVLNFGHLEFKDDVYNDNESHRISHVKDSNADSNSYNQISDNVILSEKSNPENNFSKTLIIDNIKEVINTKESFNGPIDANRNENIKNGKKYPTNLNLDKSIEFNVIQTPEEVRPYSRFIDAYTHYNGKKPYKFGSLPDNTPFYPGMDLDSIRSKSVETPPTWIESSKDFNLSEVQKEKFEDMPTNIFNFENLTISPVPVENKDEKTKIFESYEQTEHKELKLSFSPSFKLPADICSTRATRLSVDSPGGTVDSRGSQSSPFFNENIPPWLQSKSWMWSSDRSDTSPASTSYLGSPGWFDLSSHPPPREGSLTGLLWTDVPRGVSSGPVVVHCSAGIGRTGCFIAICIGINQLLGENNVDVLGIVCRMRYDRGGMVQTAEQYEFIHRALALFERSLPDQSGE